MPDLLDEYLFDRRVQECSPLTIRDYRDELTAFIRFVNPEGCVNADQVTPFHVPSFLAYLKDLGRAPATVNRAFGNVRAFFNWLIREDYLDVTPCAKIKAPKVPQIIKPLIAREHLEMLLDLCPPNTFTGARRRAMYRYFGIPGCGLKNWPLCRWDPSNGTGGGLRFLGRAPKNGTFRFIPKLSGRYGGIVGSSTSH